MDGPRPAEHPTSRVFAAIFVLIAAGIVAAGYSYYRYYARHYRSTMEQQLAAIGDLKVGELVQFRKERQADAAVFFNNDAVSTLVRRALAAPPDPRAQRALRAWMGKYRATDQFERVFLADAAGTVHIAEPAETSPLSAVMAQGISSAVRSGQIVFLDFFRDERDHRVYLAILVPVFDPADRGRVLGVVGLRIDPESSLYPTFNRWPVPSRTAEIQTRPSGGRRGPVPEQPADRARARPSPNGSRSKTRRGRPSWP